MKQRAAFSILLAALAAGLLVYGLQAQTSVAPAGDQGQVQAMTELAITQEVARGGVTRSESGQIKKTYAEGTKAPAACPT